MIGNSKPNHLGAQGTCKATPKFVKKWYDTGLTQKSRLSLDQKYHGHVKDSLGLPPLNPSRRPRRYLCGSPPVASAPRRRARETAPG